MRVYPASALSRNQEMWRLWASGLSLEDIGGALGKPPGSIYMAAASCGGIRPQPRQRASAALSQSEREEISRGVASGESMRAISRLTVDAQRPSRPKQCKLGRLPRLRLE